MLCAVGTLRVPTTIARRRTSSSFPPSSAHGGPRGGHRGWVGAHARKPRHNVNRALDPNSDPVLQPLVKLLQRTDTLDDETSMDAAAHAAILKAARSLSTPSVVPR